MSWLAKRWTSLRDAVVNQRMTSFVNRRNFQEELDITRLAWVCHYYNSNKDQILKMSVDPDYQFQETFNEEEEEKKIMSLSFVERKKLLTTSINTQILQLFHYINKQSHHGINPYPPPRPKKPIDEKALEEQKLDEARTNIVKKEIEDEIYKEGTLLSHPAGFKFQIRKSKIDHPDSGYGVFVFGHVLPGTVIGFYPGTVYYPRELSLEIVKDNEYMISRYDGIVVDGRDWDVESLSSHREKALLEMGAGLEFRSDRKSSNNKDSHLGSSFDDEHRRSSHVEEELRKFRNPFGIANYINHPPPGKQPNVLCYSYDFIDHPSSSSLEANDSYILPEHLRSFIPNRFHKIRGNDKMLSRWIYKKENCYMHSIVAVATRHIINEELYLNYRFNPRNPYPNWYEQPNLEEAQRRWAKKGLLL